MHDLHMKASICQVLFKNRTRVFRFPCVSQCKVVLLLQLMGIVYIYAQRACRNKLHAVRSSVFLRHGDPVMWQQYKRNGRHRNRHRFNAFHWNNWHLNTQKSESLVGNSIRWIIGPPPFQRLHPFHFSIIYLQPSHRRSINSLSSRILIQWQCDKLQQVFGFSATF